MNPSQPRSPPTLPAATRLTHRTKVWYTTNEGSQRYAATP
jgi:hypothetical protein